MLRDRTLQGKLLQGKLLPVYAAVLFALSGLILIVVGWVEAYHATTPMQATRGALLLAVGGCMLGLSALWSSISTRPRDPSSVRTAEEVDSHP